MKICIIMNRPTTMYPSIFSEARRFLTRLGARVDLMYPDEMTVNGNALKVEYDLYVLKAKSELAFTLAGVLHMAGANILNPYPVARMVRNKAVSAKVLKDAGVPVPDTFMALKPEMLTPLLEEGPLIVKPITGSRGRGVVVVHDAKALEDLPIQTDFVFAQRYLKPEGRDHKIYVIGDEVYCVKRVWPAVTYEDKLGEPVSVTPEVREIALRCGRVFGLELYGIDIVWSTGLPYVVDMSCIPGFKGVPHASRHIAEYIHTVGRRVMEGKPMLPPSSQRSRL